MKEPWPSGHEIEHLKSLLFRELGSPPQGGPWALTFHPSRLSRGGKGGRGRSIRSPTSELLKRQPLHLLHHWGAGRCPFIVETCGVDAHYSTEFLYLMPMIMCVYHDLCGQVWDHVSCLWYIPCIECIVTICSYMWLENMPIICLVPCAHMIMHVYAYGHMCVCP